MAAMDACTTIEDPSAMWRTQGEILKAWRAKLGLTLEKASALIADEAERQGVAKGGRMVPGSYVALRRWELDETGQNRKGLDIIARAYGTTPDGIRALPPNGDAPRHVEVPADLAEDVAKYTEFLKAQRDR